MGAQMVSKKGKKKRVAAAFAMAAALGVAEPAKAAQPLFETKLVESVPAENYEGRDREVTKAWDEALDIAEMAGVATLLFSLGIAFGKVKSPAPAPVPVSPARTLQPAPTTSRNRKRG